MFYTQLHKLIGITAILYSLAFVSGTQAAVMDYVESFERKLPPELRLQFTQPIQYVSHTPRSAANEIEIQVRFLQPFGTSDLNIAKKQRITGNYSKAVPVLDLSYEPEASDRGIVTLRFKRRVNTLIRESADKRALIINILPNQQKESKSVVEPAPPTSPKSSGTVYKNRYVVNLKSSTRPISTPEIVDPGSREEYAVYTTQNMVDGRQWTRLRIGFFETKSQAIKFLSALKSKFPNAWITKASIEEIKHALSQSRNIQKTPSSTLTRIAPVKKLPITAPKPITEPKPTRPKISDDRIEVLMEEARQAVVSGDHSRAIQLYTKILEFPNHPYRKQALEFLGVAREKKGQLAHAIAVYKRYLARYPEGEGADRVKQRLAGITTASKRIPPGSRKLKRKIETNPWDIYGGLSMFYRRDENTSDDIEESVTQSSLSNDLDFTARRRTRTSDIQTRFTGSYLFDFLDNSSGDQTSVSSLYIDATDKTHGLSMRLGRQSRSTGGVLGRVDGLLLGYKTTDWLTLNAITGFPVLSTRDQIKTDRYLYGISADLGTFANAWDFNAFIIEQKANDIVDRRAIGGEARYFDTRHSLLTFLDYDISYQSLNTLVMIGTWRLESKTTFNASIDYRNSPILTTTNAIQGQPVRTVDELQDLFTEDEIRQLAEDRTSESKTITFGVSQPLSEKLQINGDLTVSNISNTKGSDLNGDGVIDSTLFDLNGDGIDETDIQPIPSTGNEYFYNLQLIGSSLIKSGDTSILGLRYSDTSTSNTTTLSLNTRYPVNRQWRINPRMRIDYRENSNDDSTQWTFSPEIRTDYRWRKRYRFEFELGGEWSTRELVQGNEDTSSFFFSLGYRADF